jgi:hypothetical protein
VLNWKTLKRSALEGSSHVTAKGLSAAIAAATAYLNVYRHAYGWRKAA